MSHSTRRVFLGGLAMGGAAFTATARSPRSRSARPLRPKARFTQTSCRSTLITTC